MLQQQINTIKNMLSEAMIDLALEAFKKGIKTTLVPASCNHKGIDTVEMITKLDDKFDYADIYANDIVSFEKGIKFIAEHGTKTPQAEAHTFPDSGPLELNMPEDEYNFIAIEESEVVDFAERNGY